MSHEFTVLPFLAAVPQRYGARYKSAEQNRYGSDYRDHHFPSDPTDRLLSDPHPILSLRSDSLVDLRVS